jgi:hypothetical protein
MASDWQDFLDDQGLGHGPAAFDYWLNTMEGWCDDEELMAGTDDTDDAGSGSTE